MRLFTESWVRPPQPRNVDGTYPRGQVPQWLLVTAGAFVVFVGLDVCWSWAEGGFGVRDLVLQSAVLVGVLLGLFSRWGGLALTGTCAFLGVGSPEALGIGVLGIVAVVAVCVVCDGGVRIALCIAGALSWAGLVWGVYGVSGAFLTGWVVNLALAVVLGWGLRLGDRLLLRARHDHRVAEERRRLAQQQERDALARDLHDVVAHQLTLISLVAGSRSRSTDPGQMRDALQEIRAASSEALAELRSLLDLLRSVGLPEVRGASDRWEMDEAVRLLVHRLRSLGFAAEHEGHPDLARLTPSVGDALRRILQEAVTNVIKYAESGTPVRIVTATDGDAVRLVVCSVPGAGAGRAHVAAESSRVGLMSMRERALLVGGWLDAGVRDGEWVVDARLPMGGPTHGSATTPS